MKKITSLAISLALMFSLFAPVSAQQPVSTPAPEPLPQQQTAPPDHDEDVVRITTNLVQVDAVIVDKSGKQVTDLRAEDFEVFEDNRPQKITNFSYVSNETIPRSVADSIAAAPVRKSTDKLAPPEPPRRLRPEQVRRTMALVVDDLGLSFGSTDAVRDALRKFVDEQMQPNDLVAIIRTSAGVGALQQFTSDKRQLHAAIDRVKWYLNGRGGISAFAPIESNPLLNINASPAGDVRDDTGRTATDIDAELGDFREEIFAVGTLGALNFVVRGMRELPGRKSIVLFSDGFPLNSSDRGPSNERILRALRQLTDLANRASVVVYSIDARGLVVPGFSAEDDLSGRTFEQIESARRRRDAQLFDTQTGMHYLSQETGGFLVKNNNDLARAIKRVVEDQKGYYLIGYRPESATFDRRYHRIRVKVKVPDLKVRTRTGFYGIRDEETRPVRRTREQQLLGALTSPFAAADVRLRLTTIFGNYAQGGSFLRSLMHFDGRNLKFAKEPDGTYKAVIDVLGVTFGDNGRVIDSRDQTGTLKMNESTYRAALRDGLVYSFDVPVKKAGAYQLRMAVRDTATERTGSASQFVEVPDLNNDRLTLSGLVVSGLRKDVQTKHLTGSTASTSGAQAEGESTQGAASETGAFGSPAVRRFSPRSTLAFGYVIYNARLDKTANRPQLTTQTRIFRNGQPVYTGDETPLAVTQSPDLKRINLGGSLQLGANLPPGEYVLQVIVTDALAKEKHRTATQWIDFEIVK
ncbi:MAG: VWA domain-containing protein [Pyrinomonadaceae bacterium]